MQQLQKRRVSQTKILHLEQANILDIDEMQTQEITKHALMIQDKTQASTGRAKQALEETIQVPKVYLDWYLCK